MSLYELCDAIDNACALPYLIGFFGIGIFVTLQTRFIQFRAFPLFIKLLSRGIKHHHVTKNEQSINPFKALLTSMATTIGMGNIVGPAIAISTGGPGALFWLVIYSFFGAATKFAEIIFSINMRTRLQSGKLLGGPAQYLRFVSPFLAVWYASITVLLFSSWSAVQANTLATIYHLESIPQWATGLGLATILFLVLLGGIVRIGEIASKLVPLMFVLYVFFTFSILLSDIPALIQAFKLIFHHAFSGAAATGGFLGATVIKAMHCGVQRNIFITEAGLGTSSVAHAMADTDKPAEQAVLGMFSIIADTLLALLSGLLVVATGVWSQGTFSNTAIYEIFKTYSPGVGKWVLLLSISLFVITTIIGNSFNGSQSFASFTKYRFMIWYYLGVAAAVFIGAYTAVPTIWKVMDVLLICVAVPHVIGLFILSIRRSDLLKF